MGARRQADDSVVAALRRRRASGPPWNDGRRIALVAEGGAMRGVFAGGMVSAIEELGFAGCFDLFVGTSAGACALAYLRAGQARFGTRMFYENLNTGEFIRHRRLLVGQPIVSIDFLVDDVFTRQKPLDLEALKAPGPELYAMAADIDRVEAHALTGFDQPDRALENLRASSRMPLLSGGPVTIADSRYLDGGLFAPIPLETASALGATDALVILTFPPGAAQTRQAPAADRLIAYPALRRRYGKAFDARAQAANAEYAALYEALSHGEEAALHQMRVQAVSPAVDGPRVHRTTQSTALLQAGARHGFEQMRQLLVTT